MIDFAINNPEKWQSIQDDVAIIYPEPTVWSEHPFIALTAEGKELMEALQDERLQQIAAERYGFRTLYAETGNQELPQNIEMVDLVNQIMPMPKAQVMEEAMGIIGEYP